MTRVEHFVVSCLWALVGAGLGLVAGLSAGYRNGAFRPSTSLVVGDVTVADFEQAMDAMRDAAQSN